MLVVTTLIVPTSRRFILKIPFPSSRRCSYCRSKFWMLLWLLFLMLLLLVVRSYDYHSVPIIVPSYRRAGLPHLLTLLVSPLMTFLLTIIGFPIIIPSSRLIVVLIYCTPRFCYPLSTFLSFLISMFLYS